MASEDAAAGFRALLSRAGVAVGGARPWDLRVLDPRFYARALDFGGPGLGESYADGWWDADRLDQLFHRLIKAGLHERLAPSPWVRCRKLAARWLARAAAGRGAAGEGGRGDLGADLYRAMLGKRMSHTSALWDGSDGLDAAEESALELACRKLELKPGMSVLDMGCGWGAFARYAAESRGVSVVGVDILSDQVLFARARCRGLPVALRIQDFRDVRGRFDRVVAFGLLERSGPRNARVLMEAVARCLKGDGIALIHAAGRDAGGAVRDLGPADSFLPDGEAPTLARMASAMEGLFVAEDVDNLGPHYDRTLLAWHENLQRRWPDLSGKYDERVRRALSFRLLSSAGSFRARRSQSFQVLMTRPGRAHPRCRAEGSAAAVKTPAP